MPIIVGHQRIVGDIAGEIARLESLVTALDRIGSGGMPPAAELEAAPLLDPYCLDTCTLTCLPRNALHSLQRRSVGDGEGANQGHPVLKGPVIRTTEVWALATELGWARTLSRLYRLGRSVHREKRT